MSKSSERRARYNDNVRRWRLKYSTFQTIHSADLSTIQIPTIKNCQKKNCKRKSDHRHHKGHEYLFATLDEETYAKRYIEFRAEDIVYLCKKCHKSIHRLYQKIIDELFQMINNGLIAGDLKPKLIEEYRLKLVKKCEDWLNRGLPNRKKLNRKSSRKA